MRLVAIRRLMCRLRMGRMRVLSRAYIYMCVCVRACVCVRVRVKICVYRDLVKISTTRTIMQPKTHIWQIPVKKVKFFTL